MIHFKDNKNKSPLNTRWAQMTKQEQIIERKKMEIKAKLESQKQAAALAAQAKLANPSSDDNSANIFSNDGSFMNQFKTLLEKQKQENAVKVQKEQKKSEEDTKESADYDGEPVAEQQSRPIERGHREHHRRRWNDRGHNRHSPMTPLMEERKHHDFNQSFQPDHHEQQVSDPEDWTQDQDSNPPEDQFRGGPGMLPPGHPPGNMPHPLPPGGPPGPPGPPGWDMMGPGPGPNMGPRPMGPGGHMMGPRGPNMPPMPPGPMPPGHMPPGGMPPGGMPPGGMPPFMGGPPNFPMPPNWGPNGPRGPCGPGGMPPNLIGPNGPMPFFPPPFNPSMMGPPGPPPPPPPTSMAQNSPNNSMGNNGPPMMGNNGPPMMGNNGPPMMGNNGPPMMGNNGPPMMGNNGPPMMGNNGPPMMGNNGPPMMGQNMPPNSGPPGPPGHPGMRPNGPPNSMSGPNGPPGPPGPMMGPNGPRPLMPPGTMPMGPMGNPFMLPRPPFGPNSNFNNPNMPFMPRNPMGPPRPELKPDNIPPPEPMKLQNIPPPMPLTLNHIPKPKDLELGDIPAPSKSSQVFSPDSFPPTVVQAASEVAANGDRWENVLKAIHTQDQNMWFLHNPNGAEYKAFRKLVDKMRVEREHQNSVKDEDKYEPEFCLDDDDSNDARPHFRDEGSNSNNDSNSFWQQYSAKREATSSQSDDDSVDNKRERRKRKKKSRWGDEPQMDLKPPGVVDIKPPGLMDIKPPGLMDFKPPGLMDFKPPGLMDSKPPGLLPPLLPPGMMAGAHLARIDENGLKLTNLNRNNQALMQYAMTNYGSTNLEPEEWKKCEDNFKLNLLYQDMLKKRSEVERLAAAGKHKYEYDSDEDTSAGTWEHKLRSREMNATEKWADELTKQAAGKHHIGDFLPPEELRKFMEKYSAVKSGKEPDLSDYKEFKLKEDNVGFKMLQKFGWSEGQGLGADGSGIVDPINKAQQPVSNLGLGAKTGDVVSSEDDEFDAYRKRMMLAYRFRPNPLNNPRRPYY